MQSSQLKAIVEAAERFNAICMHKEAGEKMQVL